MSKAFKVGDLVWTTVEGRKCKGLIVEVEDYYVGTISNKSYAYSDLPQTHQFKQGDRQISLFNRLIDGYEVFHRVSCCYRLRMHDIYIEEEVEMLLEETICVTEQEMMRIGNIEDLRGIYPHNLYRLWNRVHFRIRKKLFEWGI